MSIILGIESTCDETGIAFKADDKIIGESLSTSINDHKAYGGVIPEIAARRHLEVIESVFQDAYNQAKDTLPNFNLQNIDAIGISAAPGLVGCLSTGASFTKGLAVSLNKPIYAVNHVLAHIMAFKLDLAENYPNNKMSDEFISLIVSGGHSSIVKVNAKKMEFEELGGTIDDAAGECFDKVGRMLGLDYPAGPRIDKIAQHENSLNLVNPQISKNLNIPNGYKNKINFPMPLTDAKFNQTHKYDFSFSGLKTAALRELQKLKLQKHLDKKTSVTLGEFCYDFANTVAKVLTQKTILAAKDNNINTIVIGGGFSANSQLRYSLQKECLKNNFSFIAPKINYCTDNGSMIANFTQMLYDTGFKPSNINFSVSSSLSLNQPML